MERYRVLGPLESGGMGEVWRAEDTLLRRSVLIKRPRADQDDEAQERRFRREAEVAARLDEHPGIVPVYDHYTEEGVPWIVMRAISGADLGARLRAYRAGDPVWSLSRILEALQRAAETMAYAHSRGVVHCDLKPANIMVGDYGEVVVIDWGLALVQQEPEPEEPVRSPTPKQPLTGDHLQTRREGHIVGTLAYMSPEQAAGDIGRMGPASDIWSLGAILYEILAGEAPYADSSPSLAAYRAQDVDLVPLRQRSGQLPRELVSIAEKAMAPDPRDRFASAKALADDLGAWREKQPVQAHHYSFGERIQLATRRYPERVLSGVFALVIVAAAAGVALAITRAAQLRASAAEVETLEGLLKVMREKAVQASEDGRVSVATFVAQQLLTYDDKDPIARGVLLANAHKGPTLLAQWPIEGTVADMEFSPDGDMLAYAIWGHGVWVRGERPLWNRPMKPGGQLAWNPERAELAAIASSVTPDEPLRDRILILDGSSGNILDEWPANAALVNWYGVDALLSWFRLEPVMLWQHGVATAITPDPIDDSSTIEVQQDSGIIVMPMNGKLIAMDPTQNTSHVIPIFNPLFPPVTPKGVITLRTEAGGDRFARLWSAAPEQGSDGQVRTWGPFPPGMARADMLPDERFVAVDPKGGLVVEDSNLAIRVESTPSNLHVTNLTVSRSQGWIATSDAQWIRVWRAPPPSLPPAATTWWSLVWANMRTIAALESGPKELVWDIIDHTEHKVPSGSPPRSFGHGLAAGPSGRIFWSDTPKSLRSSTPTGEDVQEFERRNRWLYHLDASSDGTLLAACGQTGMVEVWETSTGKKIHERDNSPGAGDDDHSCFSVRYSPDSQILASTTVKGIQLTDASAKNELTLLPVSVESIGRIAWSPDGQRIAVGDYYGTLHVWRLDQNRRAAKEIHSEKIADRWVMDVTWSPDGSLMAAAAWDGTLLLLDGETFELLADIPRINQDARSIAFSPDGQHLAVGGRTLDILPLRSLFLDPDTILKEAQQRWGLLAAGLDLPTIDPAWRGQGDQVWPPPKQ